MADVAGPDAADQPRSEPGELAHQAEGLDPHVAEVFEPLRPFVHPRHRLDLVADLRVRGEVAGPEPVLDPELLGGLALGGEVLGLGPLVHHLGGEEGDLPPDSFVSHGEVVRRLCPSRRRWAGTPIRRHRSVERRPVSGKERDSCYHRPSKGSRWKPARYPFTARD